MRKRTLVVASAHSNCHLRVVCTTESRICVYFDQQTEIKTKQVTAEGGG